MKDKNGKSDSTQPIAFDFVGRVEYDPAQAASITIKPIRLYFAHTTVKEQPPDDSMTIVVKFTLDTSWRDTNFGSSKKGEIDQTLVSEKIKPSKLTGTDPQAFYKVYKDSDSKNITVDLPHWDFQWGSNAPKSNSAIVTITTTEQGNSPKIIKYIYDNLDKNKESFVKQIDSATENSADKYIKTLTGG
jgi:hypothetical protein